MEKHHSIHGKKKSGRSLPNINKSNHDFGNSLKFSIKFTYLKCHLKAKHQMTLHLSFYLARISAPVLLIVMSVPIKVLVNRKTSKIPHTIKNCFQRKKSSTKHAKEKSFIYLGEHFPIA